MPKNITVLTVKPGGVPKLTTIEHKLENLQALVGGYIECIALPYDIDLWVNEEHLLLGDQKPCVVLYENNEPVQVILGSVYFASRNEEGETLSLSSKQMDQILNWMRVGLTQNGDQVVALFL